MSSTAVLPSAADLARAGFTSSERARKFLAEPALQAVLPASFPLAIWDYVADPDEALLGLLRIAESCATRGKTKKLRGMLADLGTVAPEQALYTLTQLQAGPDRAEHLGEASGHGLRLLRLLGASAAATNLLERHPEFLTALTDDADLSLHMPSRDIRVQVLQDLEADSDSCMPCSQLNLEDGILKLRISYNRRLLQIAYLDLNAAQPQQIQPEVSRALADLADAALAGALALARAQHPSDELVRIAIIAMGKTGGQELNYISDVDVIYIAESQDLSREDEAMELGAAIVKDVARICSAPSAEGALWQVDANLRPEGKDGFLVRSISSCRQYYQKWAKSWEFQALLKARFAAGDQELGKSFVDLVNPLVWQASTREGFVADTRAMRKRVVAHIPSREVERNLKLGPGGLRDVEFTAQLLQMVHGRTDESIRQSSTLAAISALSQAGLLAREHEQIMADSYQFLRSVEHRIQLYKLKRSHVIPTAPKDVRRIARSLGYGEEEFLKRYRETRRRVRVLHEEIFYRPLLMTAAQLDSEVVRLTPAAALDRLAAIGYKDPRRAVTHIGALTKGISRTATIQRQLLPAFLEWFAAGIDPDLGLKSFRLLSEKIGSAHWYMALLRDSGVAAKRLTKVLSSSRFIADQLERVPEAVRWLAHDEDLQPRLGQDLHNEFKAVLDRVVLVEDRAHVIRRTRSRELLRIALSHMCGLLPPAEVARAISEVSAQVLNAAIWAAACELMPGVNDDPEDLDDSLVEEPPTVTEVMQALELSDNLVAKQEMDLHFGDDGLWEKLGFEFAVLGLGSFGAAEMGYSSDADVQFVMRDLSVAHAGRSSNLQRAIDLASGVQRILNAPVHGADMKVNADLRPEGKNGVLVRSLASWSDYYQESALLWEKQALLRARVIAGARCLGEDLSSEVDSVRYPAQGLGARELREIRRMKARVESERLPRGVSPRRHLKLGPGAMTDIEWLTQLWQLEAGASNPELRTDLSGYEPLTPKMLRAGVRAGFISAEEGEQLLKAWDKCWRMRRASFLWRGKASDVLPAQPLDITAMARIVAGDDVLPHDFEEDFLRTTRKSRRIVEDKFFGETLQ